MNDAQLADVRRDLLERRDQLRARLAGLAARPERGANLSFGKRIGDGTVEAVARLNEIGVGRSLEASEARIERALTKLDEGTYGRCDDCGAPIASRRLAAAPDSTSCIECASRR